MVKFEIHPMLCKSCGYCVKFCPKSLLEIGTLRSPRGFLLPVMKDGASCIGCMTCAVACPEAAISITVGGEENG